jgi:hypothetical protein
MAWLSTIYAHFRAWPESKLSHQRIVQKKTKTLEFLTSCITQADKLTGARRHQSDSPAIFQNSKLDFHIVDSHFSVVKNRASC